MSTSSHTLPAAAADAAVDSVNGQTGAVVLDNTDVGAAATAHTHAGTDIASGTVATARLDTGTGGTQVALGNHNHSGTYANASHTHAGSDISSGTVATARLDTGTSSSQVALGNHTHAPAAGTSVTPASNMQHGTGGNCVVVELVPGYCTIIGRIQATAAGSANQNICTLPSGLRPDREIRPTIRFIGSGASTGALTIGTDGVASYNTALSNTNEIDLTGITFKKA